MSYNGSGVYTLPGAQLANGEIVSATENNQFRNDVASALNTAWTRDGQAPATGNIPMASHKFTGLAAGTTNGDSVRYEQLTAVISGSVQKTSDTGSAVLPAGTTAERDGSPSAGYFRYNTTNAAFEGYNGSAWAGVGGASGGGGNPFVYENDQTVTVSYTLTSGKNGITAGPLTINSGVTVTVPTGSTWTVV